MDPKDLAIDDQLELSYLGPSLEHGPLPALIYFALSKEESLTLDPFNQPALFLPRETWRLFSLTIPGHGPSLDPKNALALWAESFKRGDDPLTPFFRSCSRAIDYLIQQKIATKVALAGLSRGAFVACHVAALNAHIETILGYAPLTILSETEEFVHIKEQPDIQKFNLHNLVESLSDRRIRFYVGNRDRRVGTEHAFSLISALADRAYERRIRSSPFEMIIGPSIGYMGHGTSPEVFKEGIEWLTRQV